MSVGAASGGVVSQAALADTVMANGSVATPAAGTVLASIAAPGAGAYHVRVQVLSTTDPSPAMELRVGGAAKYTFRVVAAAGALFDIEWPQVTVAGGQAVDVRNVALGAGAYQVNVVATRIG